MTNEALNQPFSEKAELVPSTSEVVLGPCPTEPELGNRALLCSYELTFPKDVLKSAREQFRNLQDPKTKSATHNPSFPDHEIDPKSPIGLLEKTLRERLLRPKGQLLSFIRYTEPPDGVFVGNAHNDWKFVGSDGEGVAGHHYQPDAQHELWRMVINLGDAPRQLQIIDASLDELRAQGIDPDTIRAQSVLVPGETIDDIPEEILSPPPLQLGKTIIVPIPPYDGQRLHVAEFWGNRLLHAGITDRAGHFMATAGAWQKLQHE